MMIVVFALQAVQNLDGSNFQTLETGLIQNYGLCLDRYAKHVYYIQGGNGGSISCKAYGSTPCNTPEYVHPGSVASWKE
jgi:hypothetical protein